MTTTTHAPLTEVSSPGPIWLTPDQRALDMRAVSLLEHPDIRAARGQAMERLRQTMQFDVFDGPATLEYALDNLVFGVLQAAINDDPTRPRIVWSERLPYTMDGLEVPGCCYAGETGNRVYRGIPVRPEYRYEITGRRHPTHPTPLDFSVEAIPWPAMWGSAREVVQAPHGIDVEPDGSFTVIVDATPTDGRRNHLHMPPEARSLLVRDTFEDWGSQVPNEVTVRVLDVEPGPEASEDEIVREAVAMLDRAVELTGGLFEGSFGPQRVNDLVAFKRGVHWGKAGGVIAYNRFGLQEDEALVITLDAITSEFFDVILGDPWLCSIPYDVRTSTLTNRQAQPNDDRTFTFVVAPHDPGIHNWLDTGGLRSGLVMVRWERFTAEPEVVGADEEPAEWKTRPWAYAQNRVPSAVREARVVKLGDVPAAIPPGQARVGPEERTALRARRAAEYEVRVTGRPLSESSPCQSEGSTPGRER